jgi:hypothetical protein
MSETAASAVGDSTTTANAVEPTKSEHEKGETIIAENEVDEADHVNGDAALVSNNGTIRRLPIPASDPNDPLNFPKWMKIGLIISSCWFGT